jgi:hypothetical protein
LHELWTPANGTKTEPMRRLQIPLVLLSYLSEAGLGGAQVRVRENRVFLGRGWGQAGEDAWRLVSGPGKPSKICGERKNQKRSQCPLEETRRYDCCDSIERWMGRQDEVLLARRGAKIIAKSRALSGDQRLIVRIPGSPNEDNQAATWLRVDSLTGFAPPAWQNKVGNVIVLREDLKDFNYYEWLFCHDFIAHALDMWPEQPDALMAPETLREEWRSQVERYQCADCGGPSPDLPFLSDDILSGGK